MSASKPSIFREAAREKYAQERETVALLGFISPSLMAILWSLLGLLLILLGSLWFLQVPVYTFSSGLLLERQQVENKPGDHTPVVLIFVSAASAHPQQVAVGSSIQLQASGDQRIFTAVVEGIEPKVLTPDQIQQRYYFGPALAPNGPCFLVFARITTAGKIPVGGSPVQARLQTGTTPVIALLAGLNK